MRAKNLIPFLVTVLLLTACAAPTPTQPIVVTQEPVSPAPTAGAPTQPPAQDTKEPPTLPPADTATPGTPSLPPSGYEPQPGDASLKTDKVFLDIANSQLVVIFGTPDQAEAILIGALPDPCHALRVAVSAPDANKVINLKVYSVVDPAKICTAVLDPFSATIPLGSYTSGEYTVMVNGELLGKFSTAFSPQPGDDKLSRGEANLDMSFSKVISLSDVTNQEAAFLQGYLSDPCHQLRVVLTPADAQNKINLEVYSVFDPQAICTMVIVPYQLIVPLGSDLSGHYSLYVNGQLLGEFQK